MKVTRYSPKSASLAALIAIPCVLFSSIGNAAISCPANSTVDRLVWKDVWTDANNSVYVDQTFTSASGKVDLVVNTSTTATSGAGCNNTQFLLYARSTYYAALIANDTLSIHVDWPNKNCGVRFRVSSFVAGTSTPLNINQLEYSLYDVDVQGTSNPYPWVDLIRYNPAPGNRFNGAGSNFTQTATTSLANINNCTDSNLADIERCRQTPSWSGPLNQFDFTYESGPLAPTDPIAQRIFISDIEFCRPNRPDVRVVKTDAPDPVRRGENLVYTFTVTNSASAEGYATSAVLQDTLPAGLTWISTTNSNGGGTCSVGNLAACNCSLPGNTGVVTCQMGDIAIGATKTVVVTTKVN